MEWSGQSRLFAAEVRKLRPRVPVYVVHVKARFRDRVLDEVAAMHLPDVHVFEPGRAVEI